MNWRSDPVVYVPFVNTLNDGEYIRATHIKGDIYQLYDIENYKPTPDEVWKYPPASYVRLRHEDPHGTGGYMVIVEAVERID